MPRKSRTIRRVLVESSEAVADPLATQNEDQAALDAREVSGSWDTQDVSCHVVLDELRW